MKKKMMLLIGGIGMLVIVDVAAMLSPRILKLNIVQKRMYCDKKVVQQFENKWVGKGIYLNAEEMAKIKQNFARKDELISDLQEELQINRQQLSLVQQELDEYIFLQEELQINRQQLALVQQELDEYIFRIH